MPIRLLLTTLLLLASQLNLLHILGSVASDIISLQLTFSPDAYWSMVDSWGADGLERYKAHFGFDMLHPVIYGVFGWVVGSYLGLSYGRWMLAVAGGFDAVENLLQLHLLASHFHENSIAIPISATCSSIKWALVLAFVITSLVALRFLNTKKV